MRTLLSLLTVATLGATTVGAVPGLEALQPYELFSCQDVPEGVHQWTEVFPDATDPLGTVTVHVICLVPGSTAGLEACTSTAYALTGWKWNAAYSAKADPSGSGLSDSGVMSAFASSGQAWDQATSGSIWGGVTQNSGGANAGKKDNVNQFGWKNGGGSTIAVTYTWSSGGVASESDAKYNKQYAWSLTGEANKMDVQNIATHEVGHTFGLGHPASNQANSCLTMYAYADYGETQKRSLETGDKNGISALYG